MDKGFTWVMAVSFCGMVAACGPQPGPLEVGLAEARMPVPVGIGTVGYGGFGFNEPSPFAELYPATRRVHGHPDFRVVSMSRGEGFEIIFVRSDTVGVFQQLRQAVLQELESRTGRDLDDVLLMGATHTHSGPGRVIDGGGPYDLIADRFFPEFYERMVLAIADTVEAAMADHRPAKLGFTEVEIAAAHEDRRCEDGLDYTNDAAPLIAVERDGQIDALLMSYAIHGTVLGIDELTLSQDASGAIEHAVAQTFDHPVQVMMFNSWGADVAPGHPMGTEESGAEMPSGYLQMDRIGHEVATEVSIAVDGLQWTEEPDIWLRTHRARIDRAALGYGPGEFPFEYGGVYCNVNEDLLDCDPETDLRGEGLDQFCVGFPAEYPAPTQTVFSAGQVGPFALVTFPGEPGTLLAESLMATMRRDESVKDVFFMGYSQDYLGYSILEDDWWQGGYEASGALWGPQQGAFLAERAGQIFEAVWTEEELPFEEPAPVLPFSAEGYTPYVPATAQDVGSILVDVSPQVGAADVVTFTVAGSDPWLGTPEATLLDASGQPVVFGNGAPLSSHTMAWWVELNPVPSYKEDRETTNRRFEWTWSLPVKRAVAGVSPDLSGSYQLQVVIPAQSGDQTVLSGLFEVGL